MRLSLLRLPWVGLFALIWVILGFALVQAGLKPHPISEMAHCPATSHQTERS